MKIDSNTIREIKTLLVPSMTTVTDREARLIEAFGTEDTLLGSISSQVELNIISGQVGLRDETQRPYGL